MLVSSQELSFSFDFFSSVLFLSLIAALLSEREKKTKTGDIALIMPEFVFVPVVFIVVPGFVEIRPVYLYLLCLR